MITYLCYVVLVALFVKFVMTLANKWGWIEWLQFNAPSDFFYKMFSCEFCMSFHLGMVCAIVLVVFTRDLWLLTIPIFSSSLR